MQIHVKATSLCNVCIEENKFPPCGVNTFYKSGELSSLIEGTIDAKVQNYLVCPVNAVKNNGDSINFVTEKCISCGLCLKKCPYDNILIKKLNEEYIYKVVNDPLKIASFLESSLPSDFHIFTEVKTAGNARDKRIDIVLKSTKKIYLIKVLSKIASLGRYERSYIEILKSIENNKENAEIEVIFLYSEEKNHFNSSIKEFNNISYKFTHISVEKLISYLER